MVADEAHRIAGPGSSVFATVLDDNLIRAGRRLFTTATPRYFTDRVRREAGEAELEIASMDDEAKFGPVFYSLSFGEAIGRDLLSDYQVAIIGVDDPTYRKLAEQGVFVTGDGVEVTDARTLAAHIGLAKAMRDFDLHKTISFHSRIDKARKFASDFPDVVAWMPDDEQPDGELVTSHVSGKMSAGQRDIRIQQLGQLDDHQRGLLSNARCLGEGIDVPTLDGVAFIDPKSSHIDIIQAVGRAIRKTEGKTVGTIILPVFIDTEGDPDIALDSSAFKPIWSVLKALRSHDETLAEQLDALRRQLGRKGTSLKLPSKLHIDLPTSIGQGFADAFDVRLVESSTASWEFWFGLLEDFVGSKGHSRVSSGENFDGFRLGNWLGRQRQSHHRRQLDQSRSQRLESLPGWTWDPYADVWDENYRRLAQIAEKTGTCAILQGFVTSDNVALGTWVTTQRQRWNQQALDSERADRLESIPGWTWDPVGDVWREGFEQLESFIAENGHARVPDRYEQDGFKLGTWTRNQLRAHRNGWLDDGQIKQVESLPGWSWEGAYDDAWADGFARLAAFVAREGHAGVPAKQLEGGFSLGGWVLKQRGAYAWGVARA